MKKMKLIIPTLALTALFALPHFGEMKQADAATGPSIVSTGDSFVLLDKYYDESESFVYTADLHFRSGQAGGLTFGSQKNDHYYVINMDRYENRVKLMYFASNGSGGYKVDELKVADFIGNDKMTYEERSMVEPRVREIENVNIKVILTKEDEHAYVELFIEGIKRFGVDSVIDLNDLDTSYKYEGGYLGMNCFNGDIYFDNVEIGKSDYSYFSEPYRNQYHLQPFAKWANDPNALCYHNGYYHVFYQTNPFGNLWGDMYWGHARSRDLIHFEFLPLCLFPEKEGMGFGPGDAFMWSGSAISYQHGMVSEIDAQNWFPNGAGSGLIAIFTRDGGLQDQVVISSDDEGLTWTKRHRIPQTISGYDYKVDFRDPKIFPLEQSEYGQVITWGMTLSSYNLNKGWFLKSENLLDWSIAGSFPLPTPECIGIGFLQDEQGKTLAYLTNKSRSYILGTLTYDKANGKVTFLDEKGIDISTYTVDTIPLKPLDFGPDSYASQSFYINDSDSEFYGKDIVLNWFSGDLNASYCTGPGEYADLRGRWNGGFTIPVEYGVKTTSEGYRICQKPITVDNANLEKTNIIDIAGETFNSESENPLSDVHTHVFELEASIKTNNNSPILFRVDVGNGEYMQFGWNEIDGYYVDRSFLDSKGINTNIDWHKRYSSYILGDSDVKTFYVLSDNGGLEVFCEDFSISFYFVTTASMYSTSAYFKADNALVNKLKINDVKSIYRRNIYPGEGVLYVSDTDVKLGTSLSTSKFVTCWFSGNLPLVWEEISNDGVVSYTANDEGINFKALKEGTALFKVSVEEQIRTIKVTVYDSTFDTEFTFSEDNIIAGTWLIDSNKMVGESKSNGFILTDQSGSDFTFTSTFDILNGAAAALVFRASSDMSSYLVANYDANEKIVKLWSRNGELTRSAPIDIPLNDIVLSVKAVDKNINITINGNSVINYLLPNNEPLSGKFGLNVFASKAAFKTLALVQENYDYSEGDLAVAIDAGSFVKSVTNITDGNVRLAQGFYYQDENNLYIRESYFKLLENGKYTFKIETSSYSFEINVEVNASFETVIDNVTMEEGFNVVIYIGKINVESLSVNGSVVAKEDYSLKNYTLTVDKKYFSLGENTVVINDSISCKVLLINRDDTVDGDIEDENTIKNEKYSANELGFSIAGGSIILAISIFGLAFAIRQLIKGGKQ